MNTFRITFITEQGIETTKDFDLKFHSVESVKDWWDMFISLRVRSISKH